jgi:hypothetical protein
MRRNARALGLLAACVLAAWLPSPARAANPPADRSFSFPGGLSIVLGSEWFVQHADQAGDRMPAYGSGWVSSRPLLVAGLARTTSPARLSVFQTEAPGAELSVRFRQRALLAWLSELTAFEGFLPDNLEAASAEADGNPVVFAEIHTGSTNGGRVRHMATELGGEPGRRLVVLLQAHDLDRDRAINAIRSITYRTEDLIRLRNQGGNRTAWAPQSAAAPASGTPSPAPPGGIALAPPRSQDSPAPTPRPLLGFAQPAMAGERASEIAATARPSLAVVEGSRGRGSAFLWNDGLETWAITNAHVLAGNPGARITTLDGNVLETREAFVAVEHDLCRVRIANPPAGLTALAEPETSTHIGDAVLVLGNSEGAGVVTPLPGRIVGVGPRLVEVDAPFVPGNSGSPILHGTSGQVLGVATYLTTRSIDPDRPDSVQEKTRRFGFRLDSVSRWESVEWTRFHAQANAANAIRETSAEFIRLFELAQAGKLRSSSFRTPGIRRSLETLEGRIAAGGRSMSPADTADARRRLLADLRSASRVDIAAFDRRTAYDFFRRQVEEEEKFRAELQDHFSRAIEERVR